MVVGLVMVKRTFHKKRVLVFLQSQGSTAKHQRTLQTNQHVSSCLAKMRAGAAFKSYV